MDKEHSKFKSWREEALFKAYGSPTNRQRRRNSYFKKLVRKHSETLIRQIINELAKVPDFIPARRLRKQNIDNEALDNLLMFAELHWFYFEKVVETNTKVEVYVWHGVNMAALGEAFTFSRTANGLVLEQQYQYKVS